MFSKIFKRKNKTEKQSLIGCQAELIHDATTFQYGTIVINDERYPVKTVDGSTLCKGTLVEVVEEKRPCLIVKHVV